MGINPLDQLKCEYNCLLKREKKAEEYLNNASPEHVRKWIPEFEKIEIQLSRMMLQFSALAGREMTRVEILEGFKEAKDGKEI